MDREKQSDLLLKIVGDMWNNARHQETIRYNVLSFIVSISAALLASLAWQSSVSPGEVGKVLIMNGIGLLLLASLGLRYSMRTVKRYKAFRDSIIKCYNELGRIQGEENPFIKNREFLVDRKSTDTPEMFPGFGSAKATWYSLPGVIVLLGLAIIIAGILKLVNSTG